MLSEASRKEQQKRKQQQKRKRKQQQKKTAEMLSETTAGSFKFTHSSLTPASQPATVNTAGNGAAAQVDLESINLLHYVILCFQKDDNPDRPNPEYAAKRQRIVDRYGIRLLTAVESWRPEGEDPESRIVRSWWAAEVYAECHGGITLEGKALSILMGMEAFKMLEEERFQEWLRDMKKERAIWFQYYKKESTRKVKGSQSTSVPLDMESPACFTCGRSPPLSSQRTDTPGDRSAAEWTSASKLRVDQLSNRADALTNYRMEVENSYNELVGASETFSLLGKNQADKLTPQVTAGLRSTSYSHQTLDEPCGNPHTVDTGIKTQEEVSETDAQVHIALVEHVALQLLSRYRIPVGDLLNYQDRIQQETPEQKVIRQSTAWERLHKLFIPLIDEVRQGNEKTAYIAAWWRAEVVVELSENGVNEFAQRQRQGLNSELREVLGDTEIRYKSDYVNKHFVPENGGSSQTGDFGPSQPSSSTASASWKSVFEELRSRGSFD